MYNYYYEPTVTTNFAGSIIWTTIAAVLAVVGGILVYALFLKPDKKVQNKFLNWLKEFLNFKNLLLETILKVTYIILTIFITLYSFNLISSSFVGFLLCILLGNVLLRIAYEGCLMMIMIWKNTSDINKKMK